MRTSGFDGARQVPVGHVARAGRGRGVGGARPAARGAERPFCFCSWNLLLYSFGQKLDELKLACYWAPPDVCSLYRGRREGGGVEGARCHG